MHPNANCNASFDTTLTVSLQTTLNLLLVVCNFIVIIFADDDELLLGAEAKSLSRTSSLMSFSPRLSPLVQDNSEPVYPLW